MTACHFRLLVPAILLTAASPVASQIPAGRDGVRITYLANEGVMLTGGGKTVVIDGAFEAYGPGGVTLDDATQSALRSARPPFEAVDLFLVTHHHDDHFHPDPAIAHLRAAPRAMFVGTRPVIERLEGGLTPSDRSDTRVMARTMDRGKRRREVINGVTVDLLGIPHVHPFRHWRVHHLGYLVEVGGRRVLHVGDAQVGEGVFAALRLDTARVDVALLPNWMLTSEEGQRTIARWIRPGRVVAIHLGGDAVQNAQVASRVRAAFPGAIAFSRPMESRDF